jgi:hypothetical protein
MLSEQENKVKSMTTDILEAIARLSSTGSTERAQDAW